MQLYISLTKSVLYFEACRETVHTHDLDLITFPVSCVTVGFPYKLKKWISWCADLKQQGIPTRDPFFFNCNQRAELAFSTADQRAWKTNCILPIPSCFGCLWCYESNDVAAIVTASELVCYWHHAFFFFFFWTVTRELVLSQPKWFTSEWTLLAIHIAGIFFCFLKHMVLCKWNLTVRHFSFLFFLSFFYFFLNSSYLNQIHSMLCLDFFVPAFWKYFFLNVSETSHKSLLFWITFLQVCLWMSWLFNRSRKVLVHPWQIYHSEEGWTNSLILNHFLDHLRRFSAVDGYT